MMMVEMKRLETDDVPVREVLWEEGECGSFSH